MNTNETDPIKAAFAANPDHPLVKALRVWTDLAHDKATYTWEAMSLEHQDLARTLDNYLPQPTFGERVLAHLPVGNWAQTDRGLGRCEGWWKFEGVALQSSPDEEGYWVRESSDPQAVAAALLLLSGEHREP